MDTFERRRIYFRCVQFPKIKMKNHVYKNHLSPPPLNNLLSREKQTNKISVDIGLFVFFLCFKWIVETSFIAWHKVRHLQTKVSQLMWLLYNYCTSLPRGQIGARILPQKVGGACSTGTLHDAAVPSKPSGPPSAARPRVHLWYHFH